ncbi:hypothetical protein A3715_18410 [Oleiphilus sp. HI0009]|nr:hypothetical protein A3715_18410 [Oleiphilus sp. HI0009]
MDQTKQNNEQETLKEIVRDAINNNRKQNLWNTIFKFGFLIYLFFVSASTFYIAGMDNSELVEEEHIGYINIHGEIARKTGVDGYRTIKALNAAFESEYTKAIVLDADSGGGSPAQSDIIYREIMRLKEKYPEKKVYATVSDGCMSGCYYIVSAADEILANKTSIVGSIGVRLDTFGVTEIMKTLGVERRTLAAGEHKTLLDPFLPADPEGEKHILNNVIKKTHETFISAVKGGRGEKLKSEDVFNGLVWSGEEALKIGLIDGYGSIHDVARKYSDEGKMHNYTIKDGSLRALFTGATAKAISMAIENTISSMASGKIDVQLK